MDIFVLRLSGTYQENADASRGDKTQSTLRRIISFIEGDDG